MTKKTLPFEFVLDHLIPLKVRVKPMFGFWGIYVREKIMLILRQREDFPDTNGVWIATYPEHHDSLKKDLPSFCSISTYLKGFKETEWQVLQAHADDFETSVIKACELIKQNDHRIGRPPVLRLQKTKSITPKGNNK